MISDHRRKQKLLVQQETEWTLAHYKSALILLGIGIYVEMKCKVQSPSFILREHLMVIIYIHKTKFHYQ